jgi:hypothetical protein
MFLVIFISPKLITVPFQASVLRWPSFHVRFSTCMSFTFFCNFLLTFYLQTFLIFTFDCETDVLQLNEKLNPPAELGRLEEDVSGMRK